jgi:hypothetical protein
MVFLRSVVPMILGLAVAAGCSHSTSTDDEGSSADSNLDQGDTTPPAGPLALDASFATGGKLDLPGGHVLSATRRADGTLAVLRNKNAAVALTIVSADGTKSSDVTLPGTAALKGARAFGHKDGTIVVGQNGSKYYAARIDATGAFDTKFMPDPLDFVPSDEAVDAQGRILLAGSFQNHAAVIRLTAKGGLDQTFGQQGAWIASDDKIAATKVVATSDGVAIVAGSPTSTAFIRFSTAGVMGHSTPLPLDKGDANRAGLVANQDGSFTYFGPKDDDLTLHQYAIAASGLMAAGAAIDGEIVSTGNVLVSATTTDIACTIHVADATASLTAFECTAGVDYVDMGNGKRALIVNSGAAAYVQVFANPT